MRKIVLFGVFSIFYVFNLAAQLVIDFSADVTEGCVPLMVNFTDNSTSNGNIISWEWSFGNGANSELQNPSITYLVPGSTFEVCLTVTDDLAQMDTHCETAFVTTFAEPIAVAGPAAILTCDVAQVTLDATGSSTGPEFIYDWTGPFGYSSQMMNPTVNVPGIYTLIVTNIVTGCTATDVTEVTVDDNAPTAQIDISSFCFTPYTLSAENSSQGPNIEYEWQDSGGSHIGSDIEIQVSEPGEYILIVVDVNNGCTGSEVIDVPPFNPLEISLESIQDVSCFGGSDGAIDISVSGGTPGYVVEWSNGMFSEDITDLAAGSYAVTVTDSEGCTEEAIYGVVEPLLLFLEEENPVQHVSCFGANDGAIDILVTGGTPPYTFLWDDPAGQTTEDIFNLAQGVYTVTVTDANGCFNSIVKTVSEPFQISLTVSITNELTCGACDGAILAAANGGCGSFEYSWSNDVQGQENNFLCDPGLYTVTVTDCNGCTSETTINMPDSGPPMTLDFATTCPTINEGGEINLSVEGGTVPYLISWNGGQYTTQHIMDLPLGFYTVTVTDANGCTIDGFVELGDGIENLTGGDTIYCDGDQVQLFVDAPDAVSYSWEPAGQLSCSDCPDPVLTVDLGGNTTFIVSIVESDGCIDEALLTFNVQSYLDFNLLEFSNSPVIEGQPVEFNCNVFNPLVVEWSGPDNYSANDCFPVILNANESNEGTYMLNLTDEYGCEATATVDVDILTIIDSISENSTICTGETVDLLVVAPDAVSVQWAPAVSLNDPSIFNPVAMPTETTTYTATVEDAQGNQESLSVTITVEQMVDLQLPADIEMCEGEMLMVCAQQGLAGTYVWNGPNGFFTTDPCFTIFDLPVNLQGCYTLIYTSPTGCETVGDVCIDVLELPTINVDYAPVCAGESLDLDLGIDAGYLFEWSPPDGLSCTDCPNPVCTPEMNTTYSVTVTDLSVGCIFNALVTVQVDEDCVWPGDTDTSKVVNNFDLLNIGLAYDSIGPVRPNASLTWEGQVAPDWPQTQPGIEPNFKHIDCNGDGVINADDTLAITQNWGEMHNFTSDDDPDELFLPTVNAPFYVEPDTLIEGESHSLAVILGDMDDPVDELYGLAFSLEYDSSVIVPGSAFMAFNDGWIGEKGTDMIVIQKTFNSPGRVDVGITRIDGENMSGFGEIGQFNITIEDDILFQEGDDESREGDELDAKFNISNVRLINFAGEEIPVDPSETTAPIDEIVGTKNIAWGNHIQIQPNPAKDAFFITIKNIRVSEISLHKLTGELLFARIPENSTIKVDTQELSSGIYFLKIQTDIGMRVEKIAIMR